MKNSFFIAISLITIFSTACSRKEVTKIDIAGEWRFAIDPTDIGITEKWYSKKLNDRVVLPGSMTSNGKGEEVNLQTDWTAQIRDSSLYKDPEYAKYRQPGNFKVPFFLQPLKYYKGAAWYQKEVNIPETWDNRHISLFLERCHWESRLWVDDMEIGMRNSLGTPHVYDLSGKLKPGRHTLTICVDNRIKEIDPGINSHSISDHTQTNWNGIIGGIFLENRSLIKIHSIQVFPDIQKKKITVVAIVLNATKKTVYPELHLKASGASQPSSIFIDLQLKPGENQFTFDYSMGEDMKLWDEFNPNLYTLKAIIDPKENQAVDSLSTTFGMRSFTVNGRQIEVNGRPVFLRGTLECCIFPKTGYPPTDEAEWSRIFNICRAHGLNHLRFHSWCPPEAAFVAADKAGFYLQVECSAWANHSTALGDGKPFDQYVYEESERMIQAYGNHPSFCMMAYGNEPGGKNMADFLTGFVHYWKDKDKRRIYTSGAGWPNLPVNDFLSDDQPRIQRWGEGISSIINAKPPQTDYDWAEYINKFSQPMVSHEIGQWCVYPDFREIVNYDGVLRAKNFEIFQGNLKEQCMEQLADSFLLASGKLQALCYKADIEAALRTPHMGGFQLLDLHDFPGQGTALVGVLNAFWDEKGYICPEEFRHFCNHTVPLARMKKRVFTSNETFEASAEIAHYGEMPVIACTPEWKVADTSGRIIQDGKFHQTNIPIGNAFNLGEISFPLKSISTPEKLTLTVSINTYFPVSNSWDFWVYPAKKEQIDGEQNIRVVQKLDDATQRYLVNGGSVLLSLKKGTLSGGMGGDIQLGFSSIFWNTAWTKGQAPHTLGILCNPKHPALAEFPTDYHSNWQWWDAMSHSGAINISSFPSEIKPIVRVIDDWFTNRPLALLFEAKVGKGKILVSGIDLLTDAKKRPEAQQLLYSLKKYMAGEKFSPKEEIDYSFLSL